MADSHSRLRMGPESVVACSGLTAAVADGAGVGRGSQRTGRSRAVERTRADGPDSPWASRLRLRWRRRRIAGAPPPSSLFLSPSFPSPLPLSTDAIKEHDGDWGVFGGRCRRVAAFASRVRALPRCFPA
jgi:hypothetical protein